MRRFLSTGLAGLLLACTAEEVIPPAPAGEEVFFATIEGASSRVYADAELRVLWNADDRVSIFNRSTFNREYRFTGADGDNAGSFAPVQEGNAGAGNPLEHIYSVYPYRESTLAGDGILSLTLPQEQSYRRDSFGRTANTMVSCSDDNELMFKNLCGYLCVRLHGEVSVASLSLRGNRDEPLAGKAFVHAAVGEAPALTFDASAAREITLAFDSPVALGTTADAATAFWLVVPPTLFEAGFTLTVTDDQGGVFEKTTSKRLEIKRNTLSRMEALLVETSGGEPVPEAGMTVYGKVLCEGVGVPDVVVSDGCEVVRTDADGVYQMASQKRHGYVFISVPSGYEVPSEGILPQIHHQLSLPAGEAERVDFTLTEVAGQQHHTMLIFGDIHLANRTGDRSQFASFVRDVNAWTAAHTGERIYAMTLGDMTWDLYWLDNRYSFPQYLADANGLQNLQVFHTIGNHDHSMYFTGDFDTVVEYKRTMAPTYYSFNIGDVHYIVLDDIECTNSVLNPDRTDGAYNRTYTDNVVQEQLNWLRKDLAFVPASTPLCLTTHAPLYTASGGASLNNVTTLVDILKHYDNVQFFTGHTHVMYNVDNSGTTHVFEHNAGAVCATWWWSAHEVPGIHVAQDGAPGGYSIVDVNGKTFQWQFKGTGRALSHQFRTYDRNTIVMTPEAYVPSANASGVSKFTSLTAEWSAASSSNYVYINVWNYDPSWKVEVTENGRALSVTRVNSYDPLHLVAYTAQRLNKNKTLTFPTKKTNHMFRVAASSATSTLQIRVTDRFGRVYTETMTRPKAFSTDIYK